MDRGHNFRRDEKEKEAYITLLICALTLGIPFIAFILSLVL